MGRESCLRAPGVSSRPPSPAALTDLLPVSSGEKPSAQAAGRFSSVAQLQQRWKFIRHSNILTSTIVRSWGHLRNTVPLSWSHLARCMACPYCCCPSCCSLKLYNNLVEKCFKECVLDFRSKNLGKDEEKVRRGQELGVGAQQNSSLRSWCRNTWGICV